MTNREAVWRIVCIVGARPNFMKIAPIIRALDAAGTFDTTLVHTGQHYDEDMKASFFRQLNIPEPDMDLGVGSGSHAVQTAEIMLRFEPVIERFNPHAVLVVGDVNSTIACALVAAKKHVPVFHVEAGLRSGDRAMPEEVNRVLTDQLSDLLFTTERSAQDNLVQEGIAAERIVFAGNVMIDSLRFNLEGATPSITTFERSGLKQLDASAYGLLTLHRPSNVDDPVVLERLLSVLDELSATLPLVFPVHPRTQAQIESLGWSERLDGSAIWPIKPQGYLEMLGLMAGAKLVLTDSGGIQEETTALGVPCMTLRENTERPITVEQGTNTIVGTDAQRIREVFAASLMDDDKAGRIPELWDGRAAERIADKIAEWLRGAPQTS